VALLLATNACSSGTVPLQPGGVGSHHDTGLEGTVRRGPVQPVCRDGESCDAPLQASYTLQRDGRAVVRFASDSTGHFLVHVAPGPYLLVPDTPIGIGPQTLEVVVGEVGLTHVDLVFDTGIR
jgi:hypothetical protein